MMSKSRHLRQHGLTLLEMLVVLLIAGMAITLGFQSLGQWRRANTAIAGISGATQQATLTESWLEGSLRSLFPVNDETFEGSSQRLTGVATRPVQSHQGGATTVTWSIHEDGPLRSLRLNEGGKELDLPLPGVAKATFGYMDKEGRMYEQWPPKLGLHDHLPAMIVLEQEMDDGSQRQWAAAISGGHNPHATPFEAELD